MDNALCTKVNDYAACVDYAYMRIVYSMMITHRSIIIHIMCKNTYHADYVDYADYASSANYASDVDFD